MITVRLAGERQRVRSDSLDSDRAFSDSWLAFFPEDVAGPFAEGFGTIATIEEQRLSPGGQTRGRPSGASEDAEAVAYVVDGAIAYADLTGRHSIIEAGGFLSVTGGPTFHHAERNVSCTDPAHVILVGLRPTTPQNPPSVEQRVFSVAERRGVLRVVASLDGRSGSLTVHQDVVMCSCLLYPGQHVVHPLRAGRRAWCQVVFGKVTLGGVRLASGDGAAIHGEHAVSMTATSEAEILLFDVACPATNGAATHLHGFDESRAARRRAGRRPRGHAPR